MKVSCVLDTHPQPPDEQVLTYRRWFSVLHLCFLEYNNPVKQNKPKSTNAEKKDKCIILTLPHSVATWWRWQILDNDHAGGNDLQESTPVIYTLNKIVGGNEVKKKKKKKLNQQAFIYWHFFLSQAFWFLCKGGEKRPEPDDSSRKWEDACTHSCICARRGCLALAAPG